MASFMGPLWPHYGPIARHAERHVHALLHKGLRGARVTCYVIDKPKAPAGFAGRGLLDVMQPSTQMVTLTKKRPHRLSSTE